MNFKIVEISGYASALSSLMQSKRNYTWDKHDQIIKLFYRHTDPYGKITVSRDDIDFEPIMKHLTMLAKWGAGADPSIKPMIDVGHETLLRFIDIGFVVEGLHRGAMDDLDSHAARMNSRIVRSSTRLATYDTNERSDWYQTRIRSVEDMMQFLDIAIPDFYTDDDGITWVKKANGYVREDIQNNTDVLRGNYMMSIPMSAQMKVNFFDLRHIYMRRNQYTHAAPELKIGIEQLADQVEDFIPGDLGKLIRYDYAMMPTGKYELVHIMDIIKVYEPHDNTGTPIILNKTEM